MYDDNFDGVFRFTNPTNTEYVALWNNKEYVFPAMTTSPMIIPNETLEAIQEIRKKWAYKLAAKEFYAGKEYKRLDIMGKKSAGGTPPIFDEKIFEPMIQACLKPLPVARAKVRQLPKESDMKYKATKAVTDKDNLNVTFKDSEIRSLGAMPDA